MRIEQGRRGSRGRIRHTNVTRNVTPPRLGSRTLPPRRRPPAMKADAIIRFLMPKEERFRELLARDTQILLRAVRLFSQIAHSTNFEDRRVKVVQLKAIEHEGDQVTREVFEALNSSFITPFDR